MPLNGFLDLNYFLESDLDKQLDFDDLMDDFAMRKARKAEIWESEGWWSGGVQPGR